MDFITNFFSGVDFEVILQLTSVGLILVAGPVIVFILYALRGDL
ncbi:MAG: photosystem II reaction center protein Ycf12 [Cyanobacterium sp. T60_A2020_053]|nr:photosystem II reaction center protein Ycf12 [Cyanobacterium sp. T60_A2020_053]